MNPMTETFTSQHLIDGHVHIMTQRRIKGGIRWMQQLAPKHKMLDPETTAEELIGHLRRAGVEAFFNYFYPLSPGESREINRWQRDMADRHPGLLPFASLHPDDQDKAGIIKEALEELDFPGFKFHPYIQQFGLLDREMELIYERLEEADRPVVLHTGFAEFYGLPSLTADFRELLRRHPGMKIVTAHMLYPELPLEELADLAENYPNLYLDATNIFWLCRPDTPEEEKMRDFIKRFSRRMLFGTDYPMSMTIPVEKLYTQGYTICPDRESLEDLFWRTAARLVGKKRLPFLKRSKTKLTTCQSRWVCDRLKVD